MVNGNDIYINAVIKVKNRNETNSCWNLVDPEWMESASKFSFSDSFYVHYELLVWVVNFIDSQVLQNDWDLRCTIEEIFHHNIEGQVYCAQFYRRLGSNKSLPTVLKRSYYTTITDLIQKLRYNLIWKSKPTYFMIIDSNINRNTKLINRKLQESNLLKFLGNTYEFKVNWMYFGNIKVYEFNTTLTEQQIEMIDFMFNSISINKPSLYIVKEFVWHKLQGEFIDINTLALDICTEEWSRYNLLNNFSFKEILDMDMANKDYRVPYYDEYLDRYLKRLLSKWYPDLLSKNKFIYILPDRNDKWLHYFINQFRTKISSLCVVRENEKLHYERYNIPLIIPSSSEIILKENNPKFDDLKSILQKYGPITFIISNYAHLTDSMFRFLINNLNREQIFAIDFENEFEFEIPDVVLPVQPELIPNMKRKVSIRLEKCNERNAEKLNRFVKYLLELFKDIGTHENFEIWLTFGGCRELEECSILGEIGTIFSVIRLEYTNLSVTQLNKLSHTISSRTTLWFHHCDLLSNYNVMQLVTNSEFDIANLFIEGINSCSLPLYFTLAEYLMETKLIDSVKGSIFFTLDFMIVTNKHILHQLEFFRTDDLIELRDRSKTVFDPYCKLNDLLEDEPPPFDYD